MKIHLNPERAEWGRLFKRQDIITDKMIYTVKEVFNNVKVFGDEAVKKYAKFFDNVVVNDLRVSEDEFDRASYETSDSVKEAIKLTKNNIFTFHNLQRQRPVVIDNNGINCWREKRPISKVGLCIPEGSVQSVLMLAIPAKIAGCDKIVLCVAPESNGEIASETLYAAKYCGIDDVYKVGGIQAVAAMTFGTDTIKKVYKIFGRGDCYTNAAKYYSLNYDVAIEMYPGHSELVVVADGIAKANFVAADILTQTDRGTNCQTILITTSRKLAEEVKREIFIQLEKLPQKENVRQMVLSTVLICVDSPQTALDMINEYAPECLIICTEKLDFYVDGVENAGAVLIGNYASRSAGYYATGANHMLPSHSFSKNYGGLSLDSFTKGITFQEINEQGLRNIAVAVETMAEVEKFHAHKNSISIRTKSTDV